MTRLHLFDLDGTLLHRTAAPVEISRQLGLDKEITDLESDFVARRVDSGTYAQRVHGLWAGLTEIHVATAFEEAPWLLRIRDTWAAIRERGEYCAVISLSPSFFVDRLMTWGVYAAYGSLFPRVPFTEPVDPAGILTPAAKVEIADRLCARFGLTAAPTASRTATRCPTPNSSARCRPRSPSTRIGI